MGSAGGSWSVTVQPSVICGTVPGTWVRLLSGCFLPVGCRDDLLPAHAADCTHGLWVWDL